MPGQSNFFVDRLEKVTIIDCEQNLFCGPTDREILAQADQAWVFEFVCMAV